MLAASSRAVIALAALVVASVAATPAFASTSATATYAGTLNPDSTYTYELQLNNTGTTPIKTFWFSWVPYASFLTNVPTSESSPVSWDGQIVPDTYGNSVLWDTTGAGLAPGASLGGFKFTTYDLPSVLAGLDEYFGYYPVGTSYVYAGTVASPNDTLPSQFGILTAIAGAVPEPASLSLIAGATMLSIRRRRR